MTSYLEKCSIGVTARAGILTYRQTYPYTEQSVFDRYKSRAKNLSVTDFPSKSFRQILHSDKPIHGVFANDSDSRSDRSSDNGCVYGGP